MLCGWSCWSIIYYRHFCIYVIRAMKLLSTCILFLYSLVLSLRWGRTLFSCSSRVLSIGTQQRAFQKQSRLFLYVDTFFFNSVTKEHLFKVWMQVGSLLSQWAISHILISHGTIHFLSMTVNNTHCVNNTNHPAGCRWTNKKLLPNSDKDGTAI